MKRGKRRSSKKVTVKKEAAAVAPPHDDPEGPRKKVAQGRNLGFQFEVDGNTSSNFGRVPPMQNPVILQNLFQLCSSKQLAIFRLVCRQWRDLSLVPWRSFPIYIYIYENRRRSLLGGTPLTDFLKHVKLSENECRSKPYRNMSLSSWKFNATDYTICSFWNLLGSNLSTLELYYCEFSEVAQLRNVIYKACPNLKSLTLKWCMYDFEEVEDTSEVYLEPLFGKHPNLQFLSISISTSSRNKKFPLSWMELLSHFQSLTSLNVDLKCAYYINSNAELEKILGAIAIIRRKNIGSLPLLKGFWFDPTLEISSDPNSHFKFLRIGDLNLPLQSIKILVDPLLDGKVVRNILEFHADTLETMYLYGESSEANWDRKIPCEVEMKNLHTLHIRNALYQSSEILKNSPNLKGLSITDDNQKDSGRLSKMFDIWEKELKENNAMKLLKLTDLTYLPPLRGLRAQHELTTLSLLMPNVETFRGALNDAEFSKLCEHWRGIRNLIVHGGMLTDDGVTGGRLQKVEGNNVYWSHEPVRPNISNLTQLEDFSYFGSSGSVSKLTDISIFHGFLNLPKLSYLYISKELTQFGKEAKDALRKERGIRLG